MYVMDLCILQEEAARNREQNLEEAKSIIISEDTSLPSPKKVIVVQFVANQLFTDH